MLIRPKEKNGYWYRNMPVNTAVWKKASGPWWPSKIGIVNLNKTAMKKLKSVVFSSLLCFLFLACSKRENPIEGIYVNHLKDEFSIAWDTIVITKTEGRGKTFRVEKHTGFQRIRDAKLQTKEYANKTWTADWNEQTNAFEESLYYPPIRITEDGLLLKSTAFKKVK